MSVFVCIMLPLSRTDSFSKRAFKLWKDKEHTQILKKRCGLS